MSFMSFCSCGLLSAVAVHDSGFGSSVSRLRRIHIEIKHIDPRSVLVSSDAQEPLVTRCFAPGSLNKGPPKADVFRGEVLPVSRWLMGLASLGPKRE